MSLSEQQRRECLRYAVLQWLVHRPSLSFDAAVILERLGKTGLLDFTAEVDELAAALAFLTDAGLIASKPHGLGATLFFQATSAGVLAHERGTLASNP